MNTKQSTQQKYPNLLIPNEIPHLTPILSKRGVNRSRVLYSEKADSPREFWVIFLILIISLFLGLAIMAIFLGEIFNILLK